ncbi:unnamed protein product [Blepharisma stoltei]|uniref:TmcB/TmcC TPR repeats domain-containing protein n=1 Tax=Blepharisma stoltei TaxID=1481888 RepID=A0AAU9J8T4_9CILI|nr:unnamed protein product [Blepharisma stoltei]
MFTCFTYICFGDSYVLIHQTILAEWSLYMFIKSVIILQYFNPIENSIFACEFASVTVTILVFVFGQIMDNAIITVVFTIFLQPIIIIFTILITRKIYYKLPNTTKTIKSQLDFERKFRDLLTDKNQENKAKVLNLFKKYWNLSLFQKDRLFVIWEFYYCLFLKDERLARIKLSKISTIKSSFEVDIKVWTIFNWLAKRKNKLLPDINYLHYLKDFSVAKKMDEKLCFILVELCSEFSSKSPKIEKLIKLTNKASSNINEITENYKLLTEKHKNLESYELYQSFLENITNNHDEANIINRKKSGINSFYSQNNDDGYLENYGKEVGVILISCSKASFGSIIYLNEKAASILKSSISSICGTSYMTLIPPPYDLIHAKFMKQFISECVSTHIPAHQNLIFQCSDGFLLECDCLIKLSAFHNSPYFLLSFKPKNTSRHIALISSEGLIASHSISFPCYFSTEQSLKNRLIFEIIPDFQKMKKGIPWIVNHNGKELGLVSITKKIKYRELNLLLVIHDSEELSKWKSKGRKIRDQTEINYDKQAIDENDASVSQDLTHNSVEINFLKVPGFAKVRRSVKLKTLLPNTMDNTSAHGFEDRRADEKLISEEPSKPSSTFSSFSHSGLSQRLLLESKQKIRILQWVLFAIMSSTIAIFIGILVYMISDVTHTTRMSSFNRLGNLLYDFGLFTDISRALDKTIILNGAKELIDSYVYKLGNLTVEVIDLQTHILDDFSRWDYCSYASIADESIMPQWNFEEVFPKIIYKNFYDTVTDFVYASTNYIDDIGNHQNYSRHLQFLLANGMGFSFDYANITMKEIENCEINRIKTTGEKIDALLMFGFVALGALMLIIFCFVFIVSKKHDEFWNFLIEKAQPSLVQLKGSSIDRLLNVHGVDYQSEINWEMRIGGRRKKIKSNLYKRYIWRVLIFFAIVTSYYLLIFWYLYPNTERNMVNRPKLLSNFNIRRSLLSRLTVFARETALPYWKYRLPYSYPHENSFNLLLETWDELSMKTKEIRGNDFLRLMSDELKERIFEKLDSTLDQLHFGVRSAVLSIKNDIYNILYWTNFAPSVMIPFLGKVAEIEDEIGLQFDLADRDSKNVINSQLNEIIYTTIIYSLGVVLFFFLYYFLYLNKQIKQLESFGTLPTILSMESD